MRKSLLCFSLLALSSSLFTLSEAQTISTFAGTGGTGYNGDNIQATAAEFFVPEDVAVDDSGNVYVADLLNNRIRKITAATGIITTVAGNGTAGHSGDGGPATAAEIDEPSGVCVDTAFNIYIADYQSNKVRKVNKRTGIITTIAGTGGNGYNGDNIQATSAELSNDEDIAVDDSGNVYIMDTGNYRIRKVSKTTGIITTLAGNGVNSYSGDGGPATAAEMGHAELLVSDAIGNIYFGDEDNDRVRYINKSTGIITTVCGNGTASFSGEGGPATAAEISGPEGTTLDAAGNLYFADIGDNHALTVNKTSGIMTDAAGDGTNGFFGDGGPATNAELAAPTGIAMDKFGNLYIADQGNGRIRKVSSFTTGIPSINTITEVIIYPVPNSGSMNVQLPGGGYSSIKVYDALGREVYTKLLDAAQQDRTFDLNLGNVSNGIYIMQIISQKGITGKRIIIAK
jgi:trimeric autotransporter adhesin